jgi:hypothetical protein
LFWSRDKRRFPRVQPHAAKPVEVQLLGTNFLEVVPAADISVSGIGICLDHEIVDYDLDHEIEIVVTLPGEKPFVTRGRVRSKSQRGTVYVLGLEFQKVPREARDYLARYVEVMLVLGRRC